MSRSAQGLRTAADAIAELAAEAPAPTDVPSHELANLIVVAGLITSAASERTESRGCHARIDFPERDDARMRGHVVQRIDEPAHFVPLESP